MSEITPVLEDAAQAVADANSKPPFLYELAPAEGRKVLDSVQDGDVPVPAADVEDLMIPGGPSGQVSIRIFRPIDATATLPVVLYTHGAGWVFGNAHTHNRLVRELTVRATRPARSACSRLIRGARGPGWAPGLVGDQVLRPTPRPWVGNGPALHRMAP